MQQQCVEMFGPHLSRWNPVSSLPPSLDLSLTIMGVFHSRYFPPFIQYVCTSKIDPGYFLASCGVGENARVIFDF